jgi:hypothetical protein
LIARVSKELGISVKIVRKYFEKQTKAIFFKKSVKYIEFHIYVKNSIYDYLAIDYHKQVFSIKIPLKTI